MCHQVLIGRVDLIGCDVVHQESEICEELVYCAMENKLENAELLLENGANPNFLGADLRTPLITASAEGHTEMVSLLLQYGADATVTSRSGVPIAACF